MTSLDLFLPLQKIDLDRRLVTGVATAEAPDRAGEICDYASSKPYFEAWSAEALAASGGKSMGAVRAMHGAVAAGKLTGIVFDDDARRVVIEAKIVDDDEWRKVQEGVYTGFSQGGRYVKRWPDAETGLVRFTAEPREISLVDLPCLPDATFEVVKGDAVETRAFAAAAPGGDAPAAAPDRPDLDKSAGDADGRDPAQPYAPAVKAAAPAPGPDPAAALEKAAAALAEAAHRLGRATDENARLEKTLDGVGPALAELMKRVAALEAQPMPPRAALRAVAKHADGEGLDSDEAVRSLAALPPEARALALTKLSLTTPRRY